jgi:hypothetical protein
VRTPGVLVLDLGSEVEGTLRVGRVRFRSDEASDPVAPLPRRTQPPRLSPASPRSSLVEPWQGRGMAAWPEPPGPDAMESDPLLAGATPATQRIDSFEGLPPLPGKFRIIAKVATTLTGDELPKPLRTHRAPGQLLEVELLMTGRGLALVLHPGTPAQRRVTCSVIEARRDPLLAQLLPVPPGVTTLRLVYGDGVRGVRASADSIRWLITLFGKILRLESRLDRLEEMRILTSGGEPVAVPKAKLPSRKAARAHSPSRRAPTRSGASRSPRKAAKAKAGGVKRSARRPRGHLGARVLAGRAPGRHARRPAPRSSR